jgi:hypothetical protein
MCPGNPSKTCGLTGTGMGLVDQEVAGRVVDGSGTGQNGLSGPNPDHWQDNWTCC